MVAMFAILASDVLPSWLVFIGTLTAMMTLKLAPDQSLVKGFGNVGVLPVKGRETSSSTSRRYLSEFTVEANSNLNGKTLDEARLRIDRPAPQEK